MLRRLQPLLQAGEHLDVGRLGGLKGRQRPPCLLQGRLRTPAGLIESRAPLAGPEPLTLGGLHRRSQRGQLSPGTPNGRLGIPLGVSEREDPRLHAREGRLGPGKLLAAGGDAPVCDLRRGDRLLQQGLGPRQLPGQFVEPGLRAGFGDAGELRGEAPLPLVGEAAQRPEALGEAVERPRHLPAALGAGRRLRPQPAGLDQRRVDAGDLLFRVADGLLEVGPPVGAEAHADPSQFPDGEDHLDALQLLDDRCVTPGDLGLLPQRAQEAPDLRQHVADPHEVGVGRGDAPECPLLAPAVLGDARRLLDVGTDLDGVGDQHLVEVALPDDRVLLAPDAPVGEDLPHVEEPARQPVEPVLRLPRTEERAGDGHLTELERQVAGGVVDREGDLRHRQGGAALGAGEDHVLHAPTPQRPGALLAKDPGDGVDDVGLARAVGADDDADPGFEGQGRLVGEGLEPAEGQGFEEHLPSDGSAQGIKLHPCDFFRL